MNEWSFKTTRSKLDDQYRKIAYKGLSVEEERDVDMSNGKGKPLFADTARRTLRPFEAGSYSWVLHAGVTARASRIELADPAYCGRWVEVGENTSFVAFKRMLAIADHDQMDIGAFEIFNGNRDYRMHRPTRDGRDVTFVEFVRGRHEGVVFSMHSSTDPAGPKLSAVGDWGVKEEPGTDEEKAARAQDWFTDIPHARKVTAAAQDHRIFRYIGPGQYVRARIDGTGKYGKEATDKTIAASHFLNMMDIENKEKWIAPRLQPISALEDG